MSQPSVGRRAGGGEQALFNLERAAGAPETYLVILRNERVARAAAVALQELLAAGRRPALAVVPPARGAEFAGWVASAEPADQHRLSEWCTGNLPVGAAPVLIGLDEDGLAGWLRRLGLEAYVGVPRCDGAPAGLGVLLGDAADGPRGDAGGPACGQVHLVPVATARELVETVAAATSQLGPAAAAGALEAAGPPDSDPAPGLRAGRRFRAASPSVPRHRLASAPVRAGVTGLAGALMLGLAPGAVASAQTLPSGGSPPGPGSGQGQGSGVVGSMENAAGSAWNTLTNAVETGWSNLPNGYGYSARVAFYDGPGGAVVINVGKDHAGDPAVALSVSAGVGRNGAIMYGSITPMPEGG
jgi:hypothetical protein